MSTSEASRLARLWLDRHGDCAVKLAHDMVAELEASGLAASAALWRRVVGLIERCSDAQRRGPELEHSFDGELRPVGSLR
jgi:hypothetical protein